MIKHLKYLWYMVKHKVYVYQEMRKLGLPHWRAIIHDWQKFLPIEWFPYVWSFYGPWEHDERPVWVKDAFKRAWLHHQHYGGEHHWQYWILVNDDGPSETIEMPDKFRREMLADWRGASRAITGDDNVAGWYEERRDRILLHPITKLWVDEQLFGREKATALFANERFMDEKSNTRSE